MNLDYTEQGRRPSAAQIVSDWKKGGRPHSLTVEYGETFARFEMFKRFDTDTAGRWDDSGNGCRGVDRAAVVRALTAASGLVKPRDWLG